SAGLVGPRRTPRSRRRAGGRRRRRRAMRSAPPCPRSERGKTLNPIGGTVPMNHGSDPSGGGCRPSAGRSLARGARAVLAMGAILATLAAPAPAGAQGKILVTEGKSRVSGFLALPPGAGTHPAVIVIHEWWGLNDWVKHQTDSLAANGYVALAVDL